MDNTKRWLVFWIVVVLVLILFNTRFLGWATYNDTTSEVNISVLNYPPVIDNFNDSLFVCEEESLFFLFYASDADGDALEGWIVPENPFYVFWMSQTTPNTHEFSIVSGTLDKNDIGGVNTGFKLYEEIVYIDDNYNNTCCIDTEDVNITVIEINNPPVIENVGVQTVWTQGDNSTFYKEVGYDDVEYNNNYGNLTFNISILNSTGDSVNLFNISSKGIMNFTADNNTVLGVYNITICVEDTGLTNPHENISDLCDQDGGSFTRCDNFSLTVTDENRAPNITSYYPEDLTPIIPATSLYFNITKYDADATIPDAYWYIDGVFKERDSGSSFDEFTYSFGCGVSGNSIIKVEITDGLLNDSLEWNVTYSAVACPVPSPPGGGGGGGRAVGFQDFEVEPQFITTSIFKQQGKSFDIKINNTGTASINIIINIQNLTDMAILSEENFILDVGEETTIQLYLYALSQTAPGVYFGKILVQGGGVEKKISIVVEIKEREPLFDIKVSVPFEYKTVNAGDDIKVIVDMLNVGLYGTPVDVELYLYITDFDKILLYEASKEIIAVETNISIERTLNVPFDTLSGTYLVLGEAKYINISVSTFDTFRVIEKKYLRVSYFLIIVFVLVLILFILFLLWKRRKKKREEEER